MSALLEHRGVLHDSADDLADAVLPDVRAALSAGDAVTLIVDRRTAREVREALGPVGDDVLLVAPTEVLRPGSTAFLRRLRSWVSPARRTLVVGQYSAVGAPDTDLALIENGIDLVLADLPLTVLCTCARDAEPAAVDQLRRHHRHLRSDGVAVANAGHRPAVGHSPVRDAVWGPAVLHTGFRDLADLRDLRNRVADVTAGAGLVGEPADAAVLAVHEAAVMACALRGDTAADCTVEIRTGAGTMLTEVTAPGTRPVDTDPLAVLRLFSREVTLECADAEQRIRVLSTT